jgi:sugar phosphate isomerase/epimerase
MRRRATTRRELLTGAAAGIIASRVRALSAAQAAATSKAAGTASNIRSGERNVSAKDITWSVFTKPWKTPIPELGKFIRKLGFDGIELPVRPGFQVEPQNVAKGLPEAAKQLADCGVKILSVAGPTDEPTIAACAASGVPVIRVMATIGKEGYLASVAKLQKEYEALVPLLDKHGVTIGVQNHFGNYVTSAIGLRHMIERFKPKHVAAVWDAAHCSLAGEEPEHAADIVWSHLCMVNLKNAVWRRKNPDADIAEWSHYWTTGKQGLTSWPKVAAVLKARSYKGVICLTAEYSEQGAADRLIAEDLAFAKSLFA